MQEDPRILVIDDEVDICSFLRDMLTAEGYTVYTASAPDKGLAMTRRLLPDLVMLDLKMPEMSGIEVLRRIKEIDENAVVIIITGFGTLESAKEAMRLGAYDYVTKPFDLAHLKALVREALVSRIGAFVELLKSRKDLLNKKELAELNSIGSCRPERACVWEVAVRAFLLGNTGFLNEWMDRSDTPKENKKKLLRLMKILTNAIRRDRRKERP